jgi:hypothetical protein
VNGAPVAWTVVACDETRFFESVDEPGRSTGRVHYRVSDLIHLQSAVRGLSQLQQNLKPRERQIAGRFELQAQAFGKAGVGLQQETKEHDTFVT